MLFQPLTTSTRICCSPLFPANPKSSRRIQEEIWTLNHSEFNVSLSTAWEKPPKGVTRTYYGAADKRTRDVPG
ncbi:hypothetical protein L596_027918 [Steinernema carpocapsae]|uniref:Uncharacterized protein n=1 Tax=Steinernema carpocapsae TaxID=34508 RepID=A0A4V5ZXQ3_STECR|nr:hypothetical protein L596_027918 [Steinernema carpocapsae]